MPAGRANRELCNPGFVRAGFNPPPTFSNSTPYLLLILFTLLGCFLFLPSIALSEDFTLPQPGWIWAFPRDHGAHPDFKTEWWYYSGHLKAADGRAFGYQLTFFRAALSFNEIIDTVAQVLRRKVLKIHLPVWTMQSAAWLFGRFPWFPLTTGQIRMLLEGNTCEPGDFYRDFGLEPVSFKQGLSAYLE